MSEPDGGRSVPSKPYRACELEQPGDVKGEVVAAADTPGNAVAAATSFWLAHQLSNPQSGYVVAVWDESLGLPGEIIAFVGRYGTGQFPAAEEA